MLNNFNTEKKKKILVPAVTMILGWIVYSPMCTNYFTNGDGVSCGLVYKGWSEGAEMGRIGIGFVDQFFLGRIVSPSFNLLLCLFFIGVALIMVFSVFGINSYLEQMLAVTLILVMPCLSSTLTYYYCMVPYMLAFLCTVASVWIISKGRKWAVPVSAVLMMVSLTMYQAYLSVSVTMFMIWLLSLFLFDDDTRRTVIMMFQSACSTMAGVAGYLLLIKCTHVQLTESRSFDKMGQIDLGQLDELVARAYHNFFDYFLGNELINNSWMGRSTLNAVVLIIFIGEIIFIIRKRKIYKNIISMVFTILIICCLPLGFELIVLMAPGLNTLGTTGILIVPAMVFLYLSIIIFNPVRLFSDGCIRRCVCTVWILPLVMLVWNLMLFTYAFQNVMWLNYNKTMMICQKISSTVDARYGYEHGMKIMIAGREQDGNYPCDYEELMSIVQGTLAVKGMAWEGWLQNVCYSNIFRYYMGIYYTYPRSDEYEHIMLTEEYQKMGIFPDENAVRMVGDTVVIKLSD